MTARNHYRRNLLDNTVQRNRRRWNLAAINRPITHINRRPANCLHNPVRTRTKIPRNRHLRTAADLACRFQVLKKTFRVRIAHKIRHIVGKPASPAGPEPNPAAGHQILYFDLHSNLPLHVTF